MLAFYEDLFSTFTTSVFIVMGWVSQLVYLQCFQYYTCGIHGIQQQLLFIINYNQLIQQLWDGRKRQAVSYIGILEKQNSTTTNLLSSVIFL